MMLMVPKKGGSPINRILTIVKYSVLIFLTVVLIGVRANGPPRQEIPDMVISIELRNVLLRDALNKIGDAAHLSFVYVSNKALDSNKVSLTAHKQKVRTLVEKLLRPYSLHYTVVDNRIIVYPRSTYMRNRGK